MYFYRIKHTTAKLLYTKYLMHREVFGVKNNYRVKKQNDFSVFPKAFLTQISTMTSKKLNGRLIYFQV